MSFVLINSLAGAAELVTGGLRSTIYLVRRRFIAHTPRAEEACWAAKAVGLGEGNSDTAVFFMLIVIFSTLQPVMHVGARPQPSPSHRRLAAASTNHTRRTT